MLYHSSFGLSLLMFKRGVVEKGGVMMVGAHGRETGEGEGDYGGI